MEQKEISLRYIVVTLKSWMTFFLSKWIYFLIAGIICGALGLFYAWKSKPTYTASTSFVLASNENSGGQLLGLASQFGLDLGGGSNDIFTGDNIIVLMKSRKMVQQTLMLKPLNSKNSLLNLYCIFNEIPEAWKANERTANAFPFPDSLDEMTNIQDSLFRDIYTNVSTNYLDIIKPDENKSVYKVTTISKDEIFSYYLTQYIVAATSSFYISTKTKVAKGNLTMLQHEADSLRQLLGGAISSAASETDAIYNLNPAYQVRRSASQQSQAQAEVLGTAYGEVIKNLELAKITLQKETPLYQVIDEPVLPLISERKSKLIFLILGGVIGAIITAIILVIQKYNRGN